MQVLPKLIPCSGDGIGVTKIKLEFRLRTQENLDKDIWYVEKSDFLVNDLNGTFAFTEVEKPAIDGVRENAENQSFREEKTVSIKDDYNSSFLQMLMLAQSQGRSYFMDFINFGLDMRSTVTFADGRILRKTYPCLMFTELPDVLWKIVGADTTTDLGFLVNNEPIIDNIGFGIELPESISDVTYAVTNEVATSTLTTTITDVFDSDNLQLMADSHIVIIYNADDLSVVTTNNNVAVNTAVVNTLDAGKYYVVIGYPWYFEAESLTTYYNYGYIETVEVI